MRARLREILTCCTDARNVSGTADTEQATAAVESKQMRERCIASLVRCCTPQESVIPPLRWRKRYGKWAPIGLEGVEAIREQLLRQQNSFARGGADEYRSTLALELYGLWIQDDGVKALAPVITSDNRLVSLVLGGNNITDEGVVALLSALEQSPKSLNRLALNDNPITAAGVLRIIGFCAAKTLPLTELVLSRVGRREERRQQLQLQQQQRASDESGALPESMEDSFVALLHSENGGTLKSFTYRGSDSADFDAPGFGAVLQTALCRSNLQHLALQNCYTSVPSTGTQQHSAKSLAAPFTIAAAGLCSARTALRSLELQIPLSEEAVTALAAGISDATQLSRLSLRGCNMGAESLRIIGDALVTNYTLVCLDLSYQSTEIAHPLCDSHWMSQVQAGRANSNVHSSSRPLLPIMKALHRNSTLQELIVLGIDIVDDDVEELCACIERSGNKVIRHVRHTGVNSKPLTIKLEGLLSRNCNLIGDEPQRTCSVVDSAILTPSVLPSFRNIGPARCRQTTNTEQTQALDVKPSSGKKNAMLSVVSSCEEGNVAATSSNSNASTMNSVNLSASREELASATRRFTGDVSSMASRMFSPREASRLPYLVNP
ncbi:hypothetical protein DQ04_03331010 [Trypanosoma grayi]|uniref:hypothetical protein n=1 Tax=Trypanosoma grayi TaxID=71804 RepID=UPI0004F4B535|nr:hypothetical protein DQ04_03331010 [Trypanosoma grayi]KEG10757.1 hypothetical protein DQ04_03331010 [Trypanosoma grayi]